MVAVNLMFKAWPANVQTPGMPVEREQKQREAEKGKGGEDMIGSGHARTSKATCQGRKQRKRGMSARVAEPEALL
jgi:hypothetical protein